MTKISYLALASILTTMPYGALAGGRLSRARRGASSAQGPPPGSIGAQAGGPHAGVQRESEPRSSRDVDRQLADLIGHELPEPTPVEALQQHRPQTPDRLTNLQAPGADPAAGSVLGRPPWQLPPAVADWQAFRRTAVHDPVEPARLRHNRASSSAAERRNETVDKSTSPRELGEKHSGSGHGAESAHGSPLVHGAWHKSDFPALERTSSSSVGAISIEPKSSLDRISGRSDGAASSSSRTSISDQHASVHHRLVKRGLVENSPGGAGSTATTPRRRLVKRSRLAKRGLCCFRPQHASPPKLGRASPPPMDSSPPAHPGMVTKSTKHEPPPAPIRTPSRPPEWDSSALPRRISLSTRRSSSPALSRGSSTPPAEHTFAPQERLSTSTRRSSSPASSRASSRARPGPVSGNTQLMLNRYWAALEGKPSPWEGPPAGAKVKQAVGHDVDPHGSRRSPPGATTGRRRLAKRSLLVKRGICCSHLVPDSPYGPARTHRSRDEPSLPLAHIHANESSAWGRRLGTLPPSSAAEQHPKPVPIYQATVHAAAAGAAEGHSARPSLDATARPQDRHDHQQQHHEIASKATSGASKGRGLSTLPLAVGTRSTSVDGAAAGAGRVVAVLHPHRA